MRFAFGDQIPETPNFSHVGSLFEISADIDVASMPRGPYAASCEVSSKSAPDWANAERQTRPYTLTGTPRPVGRAPDRPVLKEPYNWYLKDAAGSNAPIQLCVHPSNDPDGDPVQYLFEIYLPQGSTSLYRSSGWVSGACWESSLPPNVYSWRAKAGNGGGALSSDWSQETWNFSVAHGDVSIGDISFHAQNTNDTHMCVSVTYGGIQGPNVRAWINRAQDGSENGEWRQLDGYGPNAGPDCTRSDLWGFWIRSPEYESGPHAIKVAAVKPDSGANQQRMTSYTIAYIKPNDPQPISPSTGEHNGSFWNKLTIPFEWTPTLRTDTYQLRISTSSDVWNDPTPVLNTIVPGGTTSYAATFPQDYQKLYWSLRSINSVGYGEFSGVWFGIDRVPPTCTVQNLLPTVYDTVFQVTWGGTDNAAGVRAWDIQVQDSGRGVWTDWLTNVPVGKTTEFFTGQTGHRHAFHCRATDNGGTMGNYPAAADTATVINPNARPPTPWWDFAYNQKRNLPILNNMGAVTLPSGYPVRLQFDANSAPTAQELHGASTAGVKCDDLRIVANDITEMDRFVESCTPSLITIWFRNQAAIAGGASNVTTHQLYYGNSSATNPPSQRNGVFYPVVDGNTVRAYDMRAGSGLTLQDASGKFDATLQPQHTWVAGKFSYAILNPCDCTPEPRLLIRAGSNDMPSSAFTIEGWVRFRAGDDGGGMIMSQGVPSGKRRLSLSMDDHRLAMQILHPDDTSDVVKSNGRFSDQTYYNLLHHFAVTYNGDREVRFYIDGVSDSIRTISKSGVMAVNAPLYLAGQEYGADLLRGTLGPFALSTVARTDFSYGQFAAITTEPTVATGLVKAEVINQGARNTGSGFFIDLSLPQPTAGAACPDAQRAYFWVASPIDPGEVITLTAVLTSPAAQAGIQSMSALPGAETNATLYVQADSTGSVTEPDKSNNISAPLAVCFVNADALEGDDTSATARLVTVGGAAQAHTTHILGDQDWVKFVAQQGTTYSIQTANLGANADTVITLYGTDGGTMLDSNDDGGGVLASRLLWQAPVGGTYYVQLKQWSPNVAGCGAGYDLSVTSESVAPAKLAIAGVAPASPTPAPSTFDVTVQSQDANGVPASVTQTTVVNLSVKTGTGTGVLSGVTVGTIPAGANSVTISGVAYSKAETGVVLTVARTSGDVLAAGDSEPFTVAAAPTAAMLKIVPSESIVGLNGTRSVTLRATVPAGGPLVSAWTIDIGYTPAVVTVESCTANTALAAGLSTSCAKSFRSDRMRLIGAYANADSSQPQGLSGELDLATITFKGAGATGAQSPVDIQVVEFCNAQCVAIPVTPTDGTITIGNPCDLNANGAVTGSDVLLALQIALELATGSADMNGDHQTTGSDVLIILQSALELRSCPGTAGARLLPWPSGEERGADEAAALAEDTGAGSQAAEALEAQAAGGAEIRVDPVTQNLAPGETRTVKVRATVPAGGALVSTWTVDIGYTPGKVSLESCVANTALASGLSTSCAKGFRSDRARLIGAYANADPSQPQGLSGELELATLTFKGLSGANGSSPVDLQVVEFCDKDCAPIAVTATDGTLVAPAAPVAAKLAFLTQPGGGAAGAVWAAQPVVAVQDSAGATVTTANGPVTLTINANPGGGTLTCAPATVNAVNGLAIFAGCRIEKVANGYTLTASSGALTAAVSVPFNVIEGTSLLLRLSPNPATVRVGSAPVDVQVLLETAAQPVDSVQIALTFDPAKFEVADDDGNPDNGVQIAAGPSLGQHLLNVVTNATGLIKFGAGRTSAQPPVSGSILVATIKVRGYVPGDWPMEFSSAGVESAFGGNRLPVATQNGVVRVLDRRVIFTAQPVRAARGIVIGIAPAVAVGDEQGTTVASDNSTPITLKIAAGSGAVGAALTCADTSGGVTRKTVVAGAVVFSNCIIDQPGVGYVLEASAPELASVLTAPFNVTFAGDTEGDCRVSAADFSLIVTHYGKMVGDSVWTDASPPAYRADLDGDGRVGTLDFSIVVTRFGTTAGACAPPSNTAPIAAAGLRVDLLGGLVAGDPARPVQGHSVGDALVLPQERLLTGAPGRGWRFAAALTAVPPGFPPSFLHEAFTGTFIFAES
ncbi:MAG: hypothetical protein NTZ05_01675 [Chloroflexi bacterium]|nr:hypothetical protein [Chloroflexota bacterium]